MPLLAVFLSLIYPHSYAIACSHTVPRVVSHLCFVSLCMHFVAFVKHIVLQ